MSKLTVGDNTGKKLQLGISHVFINGFRHGLMFCNQCTVCRANPSRNSVWAIIGQIKFFVALYEAVLRFSI
jgi:hypothetical protein